MFSICSDKNADSLVIFILLHCIFVNSWWISSNTIHYDKDEISNIVKFDIVYAVDLSRLDVIELDKINSFNELSNISE